MMRRGVLAGLALACWAASAAGQQRGIQLDPADGRDLPRRVPQNHLARCLADPENLVSCHLARTSRSDGGLESSMKGQIDAVSYVACARKGGVCLELSTFDPDERTSANATDKTRLPSIDVNILFEYDRASIKTSEAAKLEQLAAAMRHPQAAGARFAIIGHTDAKGSDSYNCRLSFDRAARVRRELSGLGVASDRLSAIGAGKFVLRNAKDPLAAANRRVSFARFSKSGATIAASLSALCTGRIGQRPTR
jgi:outer membrane protein OmpA-like peptidoglycan-associated protein